MDYQRAVADAMLYAVAIYASFACLFGVILAGAEVGDTRAQWFGIGALVTGLIGLLAAILLYVLNHVQWV